MPTASSSPVQAITLFDERPFFEKALQYGVEHGIISTQRLAAMCAEAPKGMVQIARYFGNEHLQPDLERARDRMVNFISLYLEDSTRGDVRAAAQSLGDNSLLSRSKSGVDMLKALIIMPQSSHLGMQELGGFQDAHIPLLAKWSLRSLPEYHAELSRRAQTTLLVEAASWMATRLGLETNDLEDSGTDAEAVIRTGLLARLAKRTSSTDWVGFEKLVLSLRSKYRGTPMEKLTHVASGIPKGMPDHLTGVVEAIGLSVLADLPRILDTALPVRKLFDQTPAFIGRYFWREDPLAEVDNFDWKISAIWDKATGGHNDDSSLLTLFLRIATASSPKTVLTERLAVNLIGKVRKSGLDANLPRQFILQHAPIQSRQSYVELWDAFVEVAEPALRSDMRHAQQDAMAMLRQECNIGA